MACAGEELSSLIVAIVSVSDYIVSPVGNPFTKPPRSVVADLHGSRMGKGSRSIFIGNGTRSRRDTEYPPAFSIVHQHVRVGDVCTECGSDLCFDTRLPSVFGTFLDLRAGKGDRLSGEHGRITLLNHCPELRGVLAVTYARNRERQRLAEIAVVDRIQLSSYNGFQGGLRCCIRFVNEGWFGKCSHAFYRAGTHCTQFLCLHGIAIGFPFLCGFGSESYSCR